ncbi:MAG: cysteine desulfurase family protein [Dethiobacteria bacterium]|jgi:cysteine desulfurase|nr:cysteine desulfurase [Bacillota bacterium]
MEAYLDNSATTKVLPQVTEIMAKVHIEDYGNPSALHQKGIEAEKYLNYTRETIAAFLGVKEKEIIFTSGGTEANNLAVKGAAKRNRRRGTHLLTTKIEHPSVLNCFQKLAAEGFEVTYLTVNREGIIDLEELKHSLRPETLLVSIIHVNNEVGSIEPVKEAAAIIKEYNEKIIFHVDAIQSVGRLTIKPAEWGIDLLSMSAHKLHGPKGAGALYVRSGVLLEPLLDGGGQERDLRPGTENVAAIAGFGKAVELAAPNIDRQRETLYSLKKNFYAAVKEKIKEVKINGPEDEKGAPHIINLSFPGVKGEVLLHALEGKGVYVSTGSACHSRQSTPSHVLQALGLKKQEIDSALRFSFSILNDGQQIDYAVKILAEAVNELSRFGH